MAISKKSTFRIIVGMCLVFAMSMGITIGVRNSNAQQRNLELEARRNREVAATLAALSINDGYVELMAASHADAVKAYEMGSGASMGGKTNITAYALAIFTARVLAPRPIQNN